MANPLSTLLLVALLSLSAAAATRTKLQPTNNVDGGICKSLVETQGYACEEHKVTKFYKMPALVLSFFHQFIYVTLFLALTN